MVPDLDINQPRLGTQENLKRKWKKKKRWINVKIYYMCYWNPKIPYSGKKKEEENEDVE